MLFSVYAVILDRKLPTKRLTQREVKIPVKQLIKNYRRKYDSKGFCVPLPHFKDKCTGLKNVDVQFSQQLHGKKIALERVYAILI